MLDGHGPAAAPRRRVDRRQRNLLEAFADHVVSFIDAAALRPLRVVADTANGMGGLVVPAVFERIPQITLEVMYGELDGTFPNHPADPLQPANQRDLQARVVVRRVRHRAGLRRRRRPRVRRRRDRPRHSAAPPPRRCSPPAILRTHPGATILHNLICSRAVPEVIREHGGVPVRTKVGHSFIKQVMAETGAVFGGEHSAHYYFLDNFRADSGLIASMFVLDELSRAQHDLSVVRKPFERYSSSGEINTHVDDPAPSSSASPRSSPTADRTASTGSPSTAARGGSTCGRRTPSRCCGSTSRRPTATTATSTSPSCSRSSPAS